MDDEQQNALSMIRAVYEDGEAEINGRKYALLSMRHNQRRKVFAFFTAHQTELMRGDFRMLDTPEFAEVEKVINSVVTFDGSLLSKRDEHWEQYPEDYILFVQTMLGAMSYPFLRGIAGG